MLLTGGPTGPSGPSLPGAPLGPCVNEPHRKIFQSVKLIFYFGICNCKSKLLHTWYYTNSYVKYCVKIYECICIMPYLVKYIEIQNNDVYAHGHNGSLVVLLLPLDRELPEVLLDQYFL